MYAVLNPKVYIKVSTKRKCIYFAYSHSKLVVYQWHLV